MIYRSDEEFLAATVPFCLDGLEQGDAVLAVTTGANIDLLRQSLGGAAGDVEFVDANEWYRTPGRTLGAYHRYVDQRTTGGRYPLVRVIGEPVWHGRDATETTEWTRYESAINVAFAGCPAWIVCPYDTRVLPGHVVEDARRTHPQLVAGPAAQASDDYTPPDAADGAWTRRLAPIPAGSPYAVLPFDADLVPVRTFVAEHASSLGLSESGVQLLVFAANEIATNAVSHGGGRGRVAVGRSGNRIICDITDPGSGALDWYLGYLPPEPGGQSGHGLWIVRQLCDLVEVHTGDGGTTVRLHVGTA
ncbi:sensor histidine kinase [Amycolatopsis sp. A133]|uniref:sensor histidine kinase n=1 Tax=Amycolatopsis sp. A133 TaxID=3064472 RepID=UPI0027EBD039|nr:sensor histidine kinase [Amycolatopsis sp. A133]MDQ7810827.1 sensor histidine kinase [Amycolatopsis sp. A133]